MKRIFNRLIFTSYFLLVFFTPVIFTSFTEEQYEFPKMFFVYVIGATTIFCFLSYRVLFGKIDLKSFILPDKWVLAYLLVTLISVLFSSHLYTSLWGYYSRFNEGLISFFIFFGLYFVGINFLTKERIRVLKDISVLAVFPVSIYGIFQSFEVTRVYSTLGQPNWLAAYVVIMFPLIIEKAVKADNLLFKGIWAALSATSFICLWLTSSLSGILGFLVVIVFLGIHLRSKLINRWGALVLLASLIFIVLNISFIKSKVQDAFTFSSDPSAYEVSDPGLIRYGLWKGSISLATSSPKNFIIGTGPETFPYEFPFFRESILNYSSEWGYILNKPHNYYLELWAESGIFALVLYLVLAWKLVSNKDKYLAAGMLGMLVTNIFGWPSVYVSLLFWLYLAYIRAERLEIISSIAKTDDKNSLSIKK